MIISSPLQAVALVVNSFFVLGLVTMIWPRRTSPGAMGLIGMLLSVAYWSALTIFEALAISADSKMFWVKIEYPGIMATPIFFTLFAIDYSKQSEWIPKKSRILLWIIPALTLIIAWTNQYHGLMWSGISLDNNNGIDYIHEIWYWIMTIYISILLVIGLIALFKAFLLNPKYFRSQAALLLIAFLFPVLGKVLDLSGAINPGLDLTPIFFFPTALILTWNVMRYNLFDIVSVARDTLMDIIPDGMLVIDQNDRIVDVNRVLREWLDLQKNVIGKKAHEVITAYTHIITNLEENKLPHVEMQTGGFRFDVYISHVLGVNDLKAGKMLILRNVTEQREMEEKLRETNEELHKRIEENEALQSKLWELSIRNSLTGLYNRRILVEILEREIAQAERDGSFLSLVMMDIDHF